jgi:hypothetical protein
MFFATAAVRRVRIPSAAAFINETQQRRREKMSKFRLLLCLLCGVTALAGAIPAGAVYDYLVADYGSNRVLRYDAGGNFLGVFANVYRPTTVYADALGNVYVGSYYTNGTSQFLRFDINGNLTKTYATSTGWIGGAIVDASGVVYASDNQQNKVYFFKPDDTSGVLPLGSLTLATPMGMALDSQDRLYVASNGHILRWDADRLNVVSIVQNPRLNSVAIVKIGNTEAIRAARNDGQTSGYYLGWDIDGNWTGPYVETQGVPQWMNSMLIPDLTNPSSFLLVGSTGIVHYDISVFPYAKTTFIPIGSGGLSAPYGITQLVPEPATLAVLGGGLLSAAGIFRRTKK